MHHKFQGTGVALVTPFKSDLSIDFECLSNLVEHCVDGAVNFLVVMGTTGESVTLSKHEKQQVLEHVIKTNNSRLPIVLGVGGNNTHSVISSIEAFDLSGVDAILSVSPSYNKPTQEGIYQHFKAVSEASPLPIILYNVPVRTASNMTAETTLKLARDFDNIIGVKEASGDLSQIMNIIKNKPAEFLVLSGDDEMTLPIILVGGDGVISVLGQAIAKEFSSMVKFALMSDIINANQLHYDLLPFVRPLFEEGNPAGVKKLLMLLGLTGDNVRLPLVKGSDSLEEKLNKCLEKFKS
ncbi:MAG: 4-hydroxy-tetrahydrodipicolinate synthase [Bacteroidota bacterium]|nr:4-hydroxy-tetrahydrodipicolinate synthase [Bacteroidota bacterium]MEE3037669.1 4-hydroxy-tetrahydrodipicolinate synthase [Bacteroidota bacterium]